MENASKNTYCPDYAIPPGETLAEVIHDRGMTQAELAERMGRPTKTINEIVKGKAAITPETAIQLERVLGVPARFWNSLEKNYREDLARIQETEKLRNGGEWLGHFPLKAMAEHGWLSLTDDIGENVGRVLQYFGVASIAVWEKHWLRISNTPAGLAFRKSAKYEVDIYALAAWLRQGEIKAEKITLKEFDKQKFQQAVKDLRKCVNMTPSDFQSELVKKCAKCGVAVVFTRELPHVPVSGITRWPCTNHAIIQLSLRYKTDDQFWFSFFHEVGHVILHGKRDFAYEEDTEAWEREANDFAAEMLIPRSAYNYFTQRKSYTANRIKAFAQSQGITPGIVVGRLQHDRQLPFASPLNKLKIHFRWADK